MTATVLNPCDHPELVQECSTCGGPARPVEVIEHIGDRYIDGTEVGPFLEAEFLCSAARCNTTFRGFVVFDDYHRARISVGEPVDAPGVAERIAVAMAESAARDLASAAAVGAAMRVDLGHHLMYERTFAQVYYEQYDTCLVEARTRVRRERAAGPVSDDGDRPLD